MFWAFAAIVLLLILVITVSNRGLVRTIGIVLLAALLAIGVLQRLGYESGPESAGERGKPTSPAAAIAALPLDLISVENLTLTGNGAPFEVRGHVTNASTDRRIRSITLSLVRRDCYEGALDPSGCVVIWQDQHWMAISVPPQGERNFADTFYAHTPVPRARGTVKQEFRLVAATGEAVAP